MKLLTVFLAFCVALQVNTVNAEQAPGATNDVGYNLGTPSEQVNSLMSSVEKSVREAAVRVVVPFTGGHGSGSYVKYKDVHLVITAQHVTDGPIGSTYLLVHKEETHIGTLVYSDPQNDIAVLFVQNAFKTIEPMKYNPLDKIADVGTEIYYSGFPSHHKLMSFTGRVAGYENTDGSSPGKEIILQTYGWFGCSGSIIYDKKGRQVGVLYGVDVEHWPYSQVQENLIWVAPITRLNIDRAISPVCLGWRGKLPKACK